MKCLLFFLPREFTFVYISPQENNQLALDKLHGTVKKHKLVYRDAFSIITRDINRASLKKTLPNYGQHISCSTRRPEVVCIAQSWVSSTQGRLGAARKPEKQVTKMVIVMILAFLFCWSPYAAFSITVITCPTIELDPRMSAIPAFFSKTATVYNPVIYVFMNRQFRKCVLQMFSLNEPDTIPTAEHPMQGGNHDEREMTTVARMKTSYSITTKDEECSKRDTFAQLPIPEDDVCPM
ncbi:opsin-VA-like [Amblyraja radiata]|uniref:opsin-VA-like n=1 Tax=Amblyraja radiata TaxID=386614 RepID=UPI0014032C35|nr:opsin-VA-like [Amblyraja radiata]